jgi:hypothetical protein
MGILGSIMDMGHTTGPLVSGIVAAYFGISRSFIGASLVVAVIAMIYLVTVGYSKELSKDVD